MKKTSYSFMLAAVFFSCGGTPEKVDEPVPPMAPDTLETVLYEPIAPELVKKFGKVKELPFLQDSLYLQKVSEKMKFPLTAVEVKYLTQDFVESDAVPSAHHQLTDYFGIDSIIASGEKNAVFQAEEEGYIVVHSQAAAATAVKLNDSTTVLFWVINYHSAADSNPYARGTVLYASLLLNNAVTSCVAVGEDAENKDAPYWSETLTQCSFITDTLTTQRILTDGGETDDTGEEIINTLSSKYVFETTGGIWHVVKIE